MKKLLLWFLGLFLRAKNYRKELVENRKHPYRDPPWVEKSVEDPIPPETEFVRIKREGEGHFAVVERLKKKWNFKMSWNYDLPDTLFGILGFGVLFGAFALVTYSIFGAVTSSKTIDYCYVSYSENKEKATERETDKARMDAEGNIVRQKYTLMGHVNWEHDRSLASFDNLPETLKAAESLQCQVK